MSEGISGLTFDPEIGRDKPEVLAVGGQLVTFKPVASLVITADVATLGVIIEVTLGREIDSGAQPTDTGCCGGGEEGSQDEQEKEGGGSDKAGHLQGKAIEIVKERMKLDWCTMAPMNLDCIYKEGNGYFVKTWITGRQ